MIKQKFYGLLDAINSIDRLELVTVLTLFLILLHSHSKWYIESPIIVLSILGLIFSRIRKNDIYWFLMAALLVSVNYFHWYEMDNHKYLLSYWSIVMFCIYLAPAEYRNSILNFNARALIALVFIFATVWKILSLDYLDNTFFEFTLLTDHRFEYFTTWLSDIGIHTLEMNRDLENLLVRGYLDNIVINDVELLSTEGVVKLAWFITLWTVIYEAMLALVFLLPNYRIIEILRNVMLLIFGASTYLIAPVIGFGWLLMIMGLAQAPAKSRYFPFLYLIVFILIEFFTMPYGEIINVIFGR
ncbi:MAG: hypothetical protein AAF462_00695 [Thermodesulfobacteriota bacterium]